MATNEASRNVRKLLAEIAVLEARGALLSTDARTLRRQLRDNVAGGDWRAVQQRLKALTMSWNPYQTSSDEVTTDKKDFYSLLQIGDRQNVTSEDVRRQFRKLALQVHPDKRRSTSESTTKYETAFAQLRLAYETLRDPVSRAQYDAQLAEWATGDMPEEKVKTHAAVEGSRDFASLEWMARVKHKTDVMDRIPEWSKLLGLNATDLRFENGRVCTGTECGKIVTMDRDLECLGSSRRRVFVCLLHKYLHACDELCTSAPEAPEMDRKVCPMRACALVQSWIFDSLQHEGSTELVESEITLGDDKHQFALAAAADCCKSSCKGKFQFLDDGIFACRRHGTPHICTFDQCDRKKLTADARYVCWVSGACYGVHHEVPGTAVRTREVQFTGPNGRRQVEMEVPVQLPIGAPTRHLLEGSHRSPPPEQSPVSSSLSPPPPGEKSVSTERGRSRVRKRDASDRDTSPTRRRISRRLVQKEEQGQKEVFSVYLRIPSAVATLPRVALELEFLRSEDQDEEEVSEMLLVDVQPQHTVNFIKYCMEELTEQQLSVFDQQLYWGDTVIGDETNVLTLDEHGITEGCVLELRLHDDCPLLMAHWDAGGPAAEAGEYNTVQISKEAEEDLDDRLDEYRTEQVEEAAFEDKMESVNVEEREVLEYRDGQLRLMDVKQVKEEE